MKRPVYVTVRTKNILDCKAHSSSQNGYIRSTEIRCLLSNQNPDNRLKKTVQLILNKN